MESKIKKIIIFKFQYFTEKLHSFEFVLGVIVTSLKIKNKELILNEGETAVFDCVVVANTAVRIHWTRDSQVVTMMIT